MRHGASNRRHRNRGNGQRRTNQQRTQVFDSNGPDVRIRGTAYQVAEKYQTLAKDAAASGDIILAESYLQHSEHYQRIINSFESEAQERRPDNAPGYHPQERPLQTAPEPQAADDDLSLPTSILGASPKEKTQGESFIRTPEYGSHLAGTDA